jgi:hypothetical protein
VGGSRSRGETIYDRSVEVAARWLVREGYDDDKIGMGWKTIAAI